LPSQGTSRQNGQTAPILDQSKAATRLVGVWLRAGSRIWVIILPKTAVSTNSFAILSGFRGLFFVWNPGARDVFSMGYGSKSGISIVSSSA
jgi:hypothetical protein